MPRILITGENSFIGRNFKKYSTYPDVHEVSLLNRKPEDIDFSGFDVVLHLAAIVHQPGKTDSQVYYSVNRDLCLLVAEAAKKAGVKQFVFLSTLKVYGNQSPQGITISELSECKPVDAYGISKYQAEKGLKKLENDQFIVSIIRTPVVYGDGVRANILKIIRLIELFPVLPFKNINNRRIFTYVENLISYIDTIIGLRASGTFLVKDEGSMSTTELITLIAKYLNRRIILVKFPVIILKAVSFFFPSFHERLYGSMNYDNAETIRILKHTPPFSPEKGLKKTIEAYLKSKRERK